MKNKPVFMIGAGGHTKVLIDCLRNQKDISIQGIVDTNSKLIGKSILDIPILEEENIILEKSPVSISLVNGIGTTKSTERRKYIWIKFKKLGYSFIEVIHPMSYIAEDVEIGEGLQCMAGAVIQPGCCIGNNVIVNTKASVDHDCQIGDHVHIAPGVICCGSVTIGSDSHIGSGSVILQGVKIGSGCLVAAGSVVIRDIITGSRVAGVPAKIME